MKYGPDELMAAGAAAASLAVVALLIYIALKGTKAATRSAVDAAGNVAAGAVVGVGDQLGLPDPASDQAKTACAGAMAAGRTWDASFQCPAGTWLKYLLAPLPKGPAMQGAAAENVITPDW